MTPGEKDFIAEINPEVEDAVDGLLCRLEEGERGNIKDELESLQRKHPRLHVTHFGMGVYHLVVNEDQRAALPYFEKSVEIFPYFGEGHYNLAACALKTCDIKKAVHSFRAAMRYCRDTPDVVARAQQQLRFIESMVMEDKNIKSLDEYIAGQTLFDEAFDGLKRNEFKQAIEGFLKVLEINPLCVQAHGNLGLAYAKMGMKAAALKSLDKALALDPNYELARFNRRSIETMIEGQPQKAAMSETSYYLEKALKNK